MGFLIVDEKDLLALDVEVAVVEHLLDARRHDRGELARPLSRAFAVKGFVGRGRDQRGGIEARVFALERVHRRKKRRHAEAVGADALRLGGHVALGVRLLVDADGDDVAHAPCPGILEQAGTAFAPQRAARARGVRRGVVVGLVLSDLGRVGKDVVDAAAQKSGEKSSERRGFHSLTSTRASPTTFAVRALWPSSGRTVTQSPKKPSCWLWPSSCSVKLPLRATIRRARPAHGGRPPGGRGGELDPGKDGASDHAVDANIDSHALSALVPVLRCFEGDLDVTDQQKQSAAHGDPDDHEVWRQSRLRSPPNLVGEVISSKHWAGRTTTVRAGTLRPPASSIAWRSRVRICCAVIGRRCPKAGLGPRSKAERLPADWPTGRRGECALRALPRRPMARPVRRPRRRPRSRRAALSRRSQSLSWLPLLELRRGAQHLVAGLNDPRVGLVGALRGDESDHLLDHAATLEPSKNPCEMVPAFSCPALATVTGPEVTVGVRRFLSGGLQAGRG